MKNLFIYLLSFVLLLNLVNAKELPAPPPESKPDLELSCDEADARINLYQSKVDALNKNLESIKQDINSIELQIVNIKQSYNDCEEECLRLCNATKADFDNYRQNIGKIEGAIRQMESLSNDELAERNEDVKALEAEINELKANKLSVIPELYDRILIIDRKVKGLYREKKISGYTVGTWAQDRDCLWNISGKMEIYGDPFQWPKIWQANTDQIRNPDIIHPGQVLKVPPAGPKTDDESKAERKYWRKKRAAQAAAAEAAATTPGL